MNRVPSSKSEIEAMFVQTAEAARSDGATLTLLRLSPSTLYFSDRPDRVAGHLTARRFVDLWNEGEHSFGNEPPNAVVASVDRKETIDAVVVLSNPRLEGSRITYSIDVLDGDLPPRSGPCTLFIDPLGVAVSPTSVVGMHRRRARRRGGRRPARPVSR
jgi:hypothetical protein